MATSGPKAVGKPPREAHSITLHILGGARTPFGRFGGSLAAVDAVELGRIAAAAAIERSHVMAADVDAVFFGNVIHSCRDAAYLARHVALHAGVSVEAPALTVNRLCGSGLQAVISGAQSLLLGEAETVLCGGTENMSQAPHWLIGTRSGWGLGPPQVADSLWDTLTDQFIGQGMSDTAENVAQRYGIARERQDAFALLSQERALAAMRRGDTRDEIIGVPLADGSLAKRDEHPRETSLERLSKLQPRFRTDGTVTAGNSSGINDGAAAVVLSTKVPDGVQSLGRIVSWAVAGVDPQVMGLGPIPASRLALQRAGLSISDLAIYEVNEAFAAQALAVQDELGLDPERLNPLGGAIALGHPVGASGARLLLTLLWQLRRRGGGYGLATLCIGGGQGIAMIVDV